MLYIFGDSFSLPVEHKDEIVGPSGLVSYKPLEKNWTNIVNESLYGSINYVNDSMLGCSNEYIFYKLREKESSFKGGDCVIVQLTSFFREWFFEDKPHMANYITSKFRPGVDVTKEENTLLYKRTVKADWQWRLSFFQMQYNISILDLLSGNLMSKRKNWYFNVIETSAAIAIV